MTTDQPDEARSALGDRTRRAIVECLGERPRAVGELAEALPVSRPVVSQHLKVLEDAGLVTERVAGTRRIHRLDATGVAALRDQLDTCWSRALTDTGTLPSRRTSPEDQGPTNFKPPEHDLLPPPVVRTVLEPRVGGHIYDVGADGTQCRWARVLAYEPPVRVVFSWDISPRWQLETDLGNTSEVEVRRFFAEAPARTRVELEHRDIDRHGPGCEAVRDGVADDAGWPLYLARCAALLTEGS